MRIRQTFYQHFLVSLVFVSLCSISIHPVAWGAGFRILDQSASATGQGTAFIAQADDPSAIHFNPAGMTQLRGVQFAGGALLVGADVDYTSVTGAKVDGGFGGTVAYPPPTHLYLTAHLGDLGSEWLKDWTVGLGLTNPFGISVEYPRTSQTAPVAVSVELPLIDIKPTFAFKLNEYISLGAGIDIFTFSSFLGEGQGEFKQTAAPGNPFGLPAGTLLEANGTDTAVGFNASLLWTPWRNEDGKPIMNLAFVFRGGADLNLKGKFLANGAVVADSSTTVELPDIYSFGIAFWPLRDSYREWKIEIDVDYEDWKEFQNLNLNLSNGLTVPFQRNYGDAFVVMLGTEHRWLNPTLLPDWEVALRGGYVYSESPIPSSTFEPAVPDSTYHAPSIGFGFLCGPGGYFLGLVGCDDLGLKGIGVDLAYQALIRQTRGISNNVNGALINGEWDSILHVGALTLRLMF